MKKQNFLTRMLLLFALIVGSVNGMWADETYIKVTSTSDLEVDGEYILLETSSGTNYLANTSYSSNKYGTVTTGFSISGDKVIVSTGTVALVLKLGGSEGAWTLYDVAYKGWVGKSSSNTNFARSQEASAPTTNNAYYWTIKDKDGELAVYSNYVNGKTDHTNRYFGRNDNAIGPYNGKSYPACVLYKKVVATMHTLSSAVSPVGVGTVTLGDTSVGEGLTTTVSATATDPAYRFKNWTKSSGTIENENSASTIFTMGSEDATVTANFELIPSHTITASTTLDGIITIKNGDDVVSSGSKVREGTELTITAAAGVNKEFASWTVTGATPLSATDVTTTLTVGTTDINISASFNDIITHQVNWSVNGNIIESENIKEGNAISFDAPKAGVPAGYAYKGWVTATNKIDTPTDSEPMSNYVSSATCTENITYYAVLAKENIVESELVQMSDGDALVENDKLVIVAVVDGSTSLGIYQQTQGSNWVKNFVFTGDVKDIEKDDKTWWTVKSNSTNWELGDDTNGKLYSSSSTNLAVSTTNSTAFVLTDKGDGTFQFSYTNGGTKRYLCCRTDQTGDNQNMFRLSGSDGKNALVLYKYLEGSLSYSGYCTTIPDESVTVTAAGLATYVSDFDLDYSGKSISAYIAKEEGGKIKMYQVNKVPAGTGVLLKADGAATVDIPVTTEATDDVKGNLFQRGNGKPVESGSDPYNYILNNIDGKIGFYHANSNTVAKNRAYLQTSINAPAAGRLSISFDDEAGEATGISEVKDVKAADAIFNLNGVRVKNMTKGLYIVNGKKMIVK